MRPDRIPLRPDYSAAVTANSRSFWRGMTAHVLGALRNESSDDIVDRGWHNDTAAKLVARAASTPANSTTSGWAKELAPIGITSLITTFAPASAAARLFASCAQLDFQGVSQIIVPKITTPPTGTWVGEGAAAAMVQPVIGNVLIGPPRKLLFGAACTAEIQRYTAETASTIIQRTVTEQANIALDTALLDATAADTMRPAGLLVGVSNLGATAGGGLAAIVGDIAKLAGAMATAKISAENMMLFMPDALAIKARGLLSPAFSNYYAIVGTPAVADSTIVAIAPQAVAMYLSPPEIEISTDALVHMATDAHDNIDTQAVAETVKSAWQANLLVLKIRLRCTWGPLQTGAVQLISSVSW